MFFLLKNDISPIGCCAVLTAGDRLQDVYGSSRRYRSIEILEIADAFTIQENVDVGTQLAGFATDARPVVRALGAAAPQACALLGDFQPLAAAARPTLVKLSALSSSGLTAVHAAQPLAGLLDPVSRKLPPTVTLVKGLVDSLVARGVPEGLLRFVWIATAAEARFDQVSHVVPSYQLGGTCNQYAETPAAGCSAHFSGVGKGAPKAGASSGRQTTPATFASAPGKSPAGDGGSSAQRKSDANLARRAAQEAKRLTQRPNGPPPTNPSQLLDWLLKP